MRYVDAFLKFLEYYIFGQDYRWNVQSCLCVTLAKKLYRNVSDDQLNFGFSTNAHFSTKVGALY